MNKIEKIEFQLTNSCNMNCSFCFGGHINRNVEMSPEIICRVIKETVEQNNIGHPLLNLKNVWLTGGEPLLVEKSVIKIIRECKLLGIDVGLSTNALLLNEHLDALLDAGLKEIRISMDSVDKHIFEKVRGKKDSFEPVMRNIVLSVNAGLKTVIRITVTNDNVDAIENIVESLANVGVSKIELKGVIPIGRADFNMMPKYRKLEEAFKKGINIVNGHPGDVKIGIMCNYLPRCKGYSVANNTACVCGYSAIYVSANGAITPCSYFPSESNYNIYKNTITEAWESPLFNSIRKDVPGKCMKCDDWEHCRNGCPAILYSGNAIGKSCFDFINETNDNLI